MTKQNKRMYILKPSSWLKSSGPVNHRGQDSLKIIWNCFCKYLVLSSHVVALALQASLHSHEIPTVQNDSRGFLDVFNWLYSIIMRMYGELHDSCFQVQHWSRCQRAKDDLEGTDINFQLCDPYKHFFVVMLSCGLSESWSRRLVFDIHYVWKGYFSHTAAILSIIPTCGLLSHFSNCPPGWWCHFLENLFLALYLAALYYKWSCLPMTVC